MAEVSPRWSFAAAVQRRRRMVAIVAILSMFVTYGGLTVVFRPPAGHLNLVSDSSATGDVQTMGTGHGQLGEWWAPYGADRFDLALTFDSVKHPVRLDRVVLAGGVLAQRPATYDTTAAAGQAVAPAAQRQLLDKTLVPVTGELTVVVSLRYLCDPVQKPQAWGEYTEATVTWQSNGDQQTQWLPLPRPLVTSVGKLCAGWTTYPAGFTGWS